MKNILIHTPLGDAIVNDISEVYTGEGLDEYIGDIDIKDPINADKKLVKQLVMKLICGD